MSIDTGNGKHYSKSDTFILITSLFKLPNEETNT